MKTQVPGLIVHPTETSDLNSIYRLGLTEPVFRTMTGWDPSSLADAFVDGSVLAFTASRKKDIMGFIIGRVLDESAEILWILVKEKYRKKGIGKALISLFLKTSKIRGAITFCIAPFPDDQGTEKFFTKINFEKKESLIRLSGKIQ